MNTKVTEISNMLDMLPDEEVNLAYEFVKRMVLAWDPDFTKLTPTERVLVETAEKEIEQGETISHKELLKQLGL